MSQENVELVRRLVDAFNRRDPSSVRELWTTDAEWWPGVGQVDGAVYRGHERLVEFIELQAETWESMAVDVVEMRDVGDQVLVEVHIKAVGRVSGITIDQITWNVLRLRDGKVATGRVYTTEQEALQAVGLSE